MQGEIRVTVIATGFDRPMGGGGSATAAVEPGPPKGAPVLPFPTPRVQRGQASIGRIVPAGDGARRIGPAVPAIPAPMPREAPTRDLSDMEIPTFIRRQMD
jgi:cell division protein FtsZ